MKIAKILSAAAASVVATAALAASASATLTTVSDGDAGLSSGTGMWLVQVFNEGNPDENKPATDYGIDLAAIDSIQVVFSAADTEVFTGQCGGAVVFSCNGGDIGSSGDLYDTYNWASGSFWGVNDPDLTDDEGNPFAAAQDQALQAEKVADYTYSLTYKVSNPFANGDAKTAGCVQVAMQEWGADMSDFTVESMKVLDASGNALVTFDGKGNATVASGSNTVVDTEAPTTGDNKNNADTGVEGVAAVAGLAVVAAGAVALSKKRK